MKINDRRIGDGQPCYIIAEIGINHNGSQEIARRLILAASEAGVDAVKFQKRLLPRAIPEALRDIPKTLQDGTVVTYLEYKERMEFDTETYKTLVHYAHDLGLDFGVSVWDTVSSHWAADFGDFKHGTFWGEIDFIKIP